MIDEILAKPEGTLTLEELRILIKAIDRHPLEPTLGNDSLLQEYAAARRAVRKVYVASK